MSSRISIGCADFLFQILEVLKTVQELTKKVLQIKYYGFKKGIVVIVLLEHSIVESFLDLRIPYPRRDPKV